MSGLSKIVNRLKSIPDALKVWEDVQDLVRKNSPAVYAVLTSMIVDQHRQAAIAFLQWGSVVDVVAYTLQITNDSASTLLTSEPVVSNVTRAFERIDALLNEEKVVALMELLRLPREA